jgi:regulator of replication initiation timing
MQEDLDSMVEKVERLAKALKALREENQALRHDNLALRTRISEATAHMDTLISRIAQEQ